MSAIDHAKLAIDANFDAHGIAATYHSAWPGPGVPCTLLPDQADGDMIVDTIRITQPRSQFVVRKCEVTPVQKAYFVVADIRYRIEEAPQPDALRLVYKTSCVKA